VWFIPNGANNLNRTFIGDLQTSANNYTGWELDLSTGNPNFYLINNFTGNNYIGVSSTTVIPSSIIHNLTFTYDGSRTAAGVKLYLDGTPLQPKVGKDALSASIASTQNVSIGGRTDGAVPVNAVLGEIRLWNRVLSATDVSNYVAAGAR
jgi:hypothetical protein